MSFATLMVDVEVEPKCDGRFRLAAQMADRFASTLIGISACVLPPYPAEGAYFVTQEFVCQERQDIQAALERTEASFRAAAGVNESKLEWRSAIDLPEAFIVSQARSADLVIVGRAPRPMDICRSLDPGALVLRAGRPMLVVPPGIDRLKAERILNRLERQPGGSPCAPRLASVAARGQIGSHRRGLRRQHGGLGPTACRGRGALPHAAPDSGWIGYGRRGKARHRRPSDRSSESRRRGPDRNWRIRSQPVG
jgi:hypothetical protein